MQRHVLSLMLLSGAVSAFISPTVRGDVVYDNGSFDRTGGPAFSNWFSSGNYAVADDFRLSSAAMLRSVNLTMYVEGGIPSTINWAIYSDLAGSPNSPLYQGTSAVQAYAHLSSDPSSQIIMMLRLRYPPSAWVRVPTGFHCLASAGRGLGFGRKQWDV